ncbi:protein of unknown function [Flexibacter flexilis DSM 6793]|uniref:DUF4407 domain-containing protein n=1 Tax=Flexibacter flexilis DSM 6793 TaxID=927664 RepID=A0A1I1N8M1_9BACT|nr:DUF4407 domain-containing protein [Flexibacter flexilis]SFC93572.1 protein of unknown function [Flexibacter flexilis DSM 6793]
MGNMLEYASFSDEVLLSQCTNHSRMTQRAVGLCVWLVIVLSALNMAYLIWTVSNSYLLAVLMFLIYGGIMLQVERIMYASASNKGMIFRLIFVFGSTYMLHTVNEYIVYGKEITQTIEENYQQKRLETIEPMTNAVGNYLASKKELQDELTQLRHQKADLESKLAQEIGGVSFSQKVSGNEGDGKLAGIIKNDIALCEQKIQDIEGRLSSTETGFKRDSVTAVAKQDILELSSTPHYSAVEQSAALEKAKDKADEYHKIAFDLWGKIVIAFSVFFESAVLILKMIIKTDYTDLAKSNQLQAQKNVEIRNNLVNTILDEMVNPSPNSGAIRQDLAYRLVESNMIRQQISSDFVNLGKQPKEHEYA